MMDYMYHAPSDDSITEINITKEMVDENLLLEDKNKPNNDEVLAIESEKENKKKSA